MTLVSGQEQFPELFRRQVCWAHLKRDFQKCLERRGPGKLVGDIGLMVVEDVFTLWREYRKGLIDRPVLKARLEPLVEEHRETLERGSGCGRPPNLFHAAELDKFDHVQVSLSRLALSRPAADDDRES